MIGHPKDERERVTCPEGAENIRDTQAHARAVRRSRQAMLEEGWPASAGEFGEASLWRVASGSDGPGRGGEVEVLEDGAHDGGLGDVGQDAAATATLAALIDHPKQVRRDQPRRPSPAASTSRFPGRP